MRYPLPFVEEACFSLMQEDAKREVLNISKLSLDSSTMYNMNTIEGGCSMCGGQNHTLEAF